MSTILYSSLSFSTKTRRGHLSRSFRRINRKSPHFQLIGELRTLIFDFAHEHNFPLKELHVYEDRPKDDINANVHGNEREIYPLENITSQYFEYEADRYAVALIGDEEPIVSLIQKMGAQGAVLHLPPGISQLFLSHPTIYDRLEPWLKP